VGFEPGSPVPQADAMTTGLKIMSLVPGRYNKFSRELPQTPWLVDGVRKMETSVEELITGTLKGAFTFDSEFHDNFFLSELGLIFGDFRQFSPIFANLCQKMSFF
jgi:hypothetical protein